MKTAKLLITVLITLGILLTGFFTFRFSTAGTNTIGNLVTIAYIFAVLFVLLSYRVSFSGGTKPDLIRSVLSILLIIGFSFMYFERDTVDIIWNYVLSGFVLFQGLNLLALHKPTNKLSKLFQLCTIIIVFFISTLFILKINSPIYYIVALILLAPTTILSLIDSLKNPD